MSEQHLFQDSPLIPERKKGDAPKGTVWREVKNFNADGEILSEYRGKFTRKNGSGFVISYTAKIVELNIKCTSPSVLRIFALIAHKQTYAGGFRTNRQYFADVLNLDRKTVYRAIEWLKDNFIVNEMRIDGSLEFMVNPEYVTVGTDREARCKLWNSRWIELNKRKHANLIIH